jgi:hypothetical protein
MRRSRTASSISSRPTGRSSDGSAAIIPDASFSITIDYAVALDLVLDRSPNGLELALAHGDIEVDGDFRRVPRLVALTGR